MSLSSRIKIHLIDTVSIWFSLICFILFNSFLEFLAISKILFIDPIFYIGFTNKAAFIAFVTGPIFFIMMRLLRRRSIWDLFIGVMLIACLAIVLRLSSCNMKLFENHVYAPGIDPSLDYGAQCAYFALLNFVIIVPKMIGLVLVFGVMRGFLFRLFGFPQST